MGNIAQNSIGRSKSTSKKKKKPASSNGRTEFYCTMCGKKYTKLTGNFYRSQSPIHVGNDGFIPVCRSCVEELFELYTNELGSEMEATKRLCQKFDWYFSKRIYDATEKSSASFSRMSSYVSKMSLRCYQGKTYDDTIRDEETVINDVEDLKNNSSEIKIKQKTLAFFGGGFEPEELKFLQEQYDDWTSRHECSTKSQEEVFKNLCIAQLNILKAQQGKGSMKLVEALKVFQDLLGTANLKPSQNNENAMVEQNTFGTLIKKWENERPISEPLPEWQDVDGIRKYITVYFLGHLCKMLGIQNKYSAAYEEEMAKYRVEMPEYEGDDDALLDAIISDGEDYGNTE